MKNKFRSSILVLPLLITILACNLMFTTPATQLPEVLVLPVQPLDTATGQPTVDTSTPTPTVTPALLHTKTPSNTPGLGALIYDVESSVTAAEKRAPYGDSYDINRLERPFLQDMTYVPDLDITTFNLKQDADWFYVSMGLIGSDPNNPMGINYAVELDTDADGFGDLIILAHPPYTTQWSTDTVQVYEDRNHNTSGLTAEKSDAPITTDGYETLIFNGGRGQGDDPDLAWVRIVAGSEAAVQFAFKTSLGGGSFMYGVLADAGLKDVTKLDYVDRYTEEEAGSPVKDKKYYPLKALFSVDNTCREVYGFKPNGYEPMLCPKDQPKPTKKPGATSPPPVTGCQDPGTCLGGWAGEPFCMCIPP
jgi:hypothetical protein